MNWPHKNSAKAAGTGKIGPLDGHVSLGMPIEQARDLKGLNIIHAPTTSAVVMTRTLSQKLQSLLAPATARSFPSFTLNGDAEAIRHKLMMAMDTSRNDTAGMQALSADILMLLDGFAGLVGNETSLVLSLRSIPNDACEQFHEDILALRLIVTYRGATTEWINPAAPASAHMAFESAKTGDILVFRGSIYATREAPALTHRSPAVSNLNEWRLVLSMSAAHF